MKRKARQHGKKESAAIQPGTESSTGRDRLTPSKSRTKEDAAERARILELRKKIDSGFYESSEVMTKIVEKMLDDLKEEKS